MRDRGADLLAGVDCSIPVPLHPSRRRHRGFNQAADLARGLGPPVCAALKRTRATATQASLPAARRHGNVRGAFAITRAGRRLFERARGDGDHAAAGLIVLLVDDVSTTGATLDACARVLKAAGAREVRALTAARVATRAR
jgi:predicted amidophosphoribosyltransferase